MVWFGRLYLKKIWGIDRNPPRMDAWCWYWHTFLTVVVTPFFKFLHSYSLCVFFTILRIHVLQLLYIFQSCITCFLHFFNFQSFQTVLKFFIFLHRSSYGFYNFRPVHIFHSCLILFDLFLCCTCSSVCTFWLSCTLILQSLMFWNFWIAFVFFDFVLVFPKFSTFSSLSYLLLQVFMVFSSFDLFTLLSHIYFIIFFYNFRKLCKKCNI